MANLFQRYFSKFSIEFYSKDPKFSKHITKDQALLEKYYPVGGVRIEDDILVTEDGYENLTAAPKGEAALRIINGEKDQDEATALQKPKRGWFW